MQVPAAFFLFRFCGCAATFADASTRGLRGQREYVVDEEQHVTIQEFARIAL